MAPDQPRRKGNETLPQVFPTGTGCPARLDGEPAAPARCVHELVREQAVRAPRSTAVVCGQDSLGYAELWQSAEALAARLVRHGVRRDTVVAIRAGRSTGLLIAMLAVLAAGGAYLVLDVEHPPARVAAVLDDARPALVLVEGGRSGDIPRSRRGVLVLEDELALALDGTHERRLPAAHPDQLAYVSYTSGSTGEPKGVGVPHRGVQRLVLAPGWAEFGPDDVFLQVAPVAFDASTFEIWGALVNGATLVVYPPGDLSVEVLTDTVVTRGVTVLSLTAGLFHQVCDAAPETFSGLRRLVAGGDVVSAAHVRAALTAYPGISFTHAYGPTENTTFTTCWNPGGPPEDAVLPIGGPVRGTQVAILDEWLRPVGAGTAGELYAAGDGLARGYLGRPAATAERFVPCSFGGPPGARMYRTGDLARLRADGAIDFLGRIDAQVKIRGYRIELGEIETRLRDDPRVRDAVVLAPTRESGERSLVAYLMLAAGALDDTDPQAPGRLGERLRRTLGERLPEYMVPGILLSVPGFPLNENGKVDRAALALEPAAIELRHSRPEEPMTASEQVIGDVWREVLGRAAGVHENFFEAGGNSLLLIRVRGRLREVLHVEISTTDLFDFPTIHQLARHFSAGADPEAPPAEKDAAHLAQGRNALRERARRRTSEQRG